MMSAECRTEAPRECLRCGSQEIELKIRLNENSRTHARNIHAVAMCRNCFREWEVAVWACRGCDPGRPGLRRSSEGLSGLAVTDAGK